VRRSAGLRGKEASSQEFRGGLRAVREVIALATNVRQVDISRPDHSGTPIA
jgi:hypothetical protein